MNGFKKASLISDAWFAGFAGNVLFEKQGYPCNHGFSYEICVVGGKKIGVNPSLSNNKPSMTIDDPSVYPGLTNPDEAL